MNTDKARFAIRSLKAARFDNRVLAHMGGIAGMTLYRFCNDMPTEPPHQATIAGIKKTLTKQAHVLEHLLKVVNDALDSK